MDLFWLGGEGPRDIPPAVNVYLHNALQVAFEDLAGLRAVQKVGFWDSKLVTFVRVYNPGASEEASRVKDFISLAAFLSLSYSSTLCPRPADLS